MPSANDLFEPRMPEVDIRPDIAGLFVKARTEVAGAGPAAGLEPGQRCIGVVTPGRMVMLVPAPKPGAVAPEQVALAKKLIPSEKPLQLTAVGFTQLERLTEDKAKCLPFLGQALALAYLGHTVVVFEGHESAFEAALQGSDVLVVDSGMQPFLQKDWVEVARKVMNPGGRILHHDRKTSALRPIIKSKDPRGWRLGEPDGEASYLNSLLTTLAKRTPVPVELVAGNPVPDLAPLATEPQQREWIAELPFRYESLSAEKVMTIALKLGKWTKESTGETTCLLQAKVAIGGGQLLPASFQMRLAKDASGVYHLQIEKVG